MFANVFATLARAADSAPDAVESVASSITVWQGLSILTAVLLAVCSFWIVRWIKRVDEGRNEAAKFRQEVPVLYVSYEAMHRLVTEPNLREHDNLAKSLTEMEGRLSGKMDSTTAIILRHITNGGKNKE